MTVVLHSIEALAGNGRYAVTFRLPDATEQAAVVQVRGDGVEVAESALPSGWSSASDSFRAVTRAVLSMDEARSAVALDGSLRDVDGGWDVTIGNVVQGPSGLPECTAHGVMTETGDRWICEQCGAQAVLV